MAYVISISNQKGGVGKTTTAVNLSAAIAKLGKKALLIDLDPQGNATTANNLDKDNLQNSICEVLLDECKLQDSINLIKTNLSCIGANTNLVASEISMLQNNQQNKLKTILQTIINDYNYIIIDCPPSLNMLTINALHAADGVIIPMQCEYYALEGLSSLMQTIERIKINNKLEIIGIVRTMFDGRNNLSNEVSTQLIKYFYNKVFRTIIPRNIALAEAPSFGRDVISYKKSSQGSTAYLAFANEVISRTLI